MEPTVGQVLYSGQSLSDLELSDVHKRIGFVMQESTLFHDTIEENLLYGKMDASEEEMKEACIKAGIYNDIKLMPAGLKTIIGENGSGLSGGQQQRIILARLFLQKKEIFILDEATSGLDYKTEEIVYDAIMAIPKDKTIIVVTHNENILHYFDKIITIRI